MTPPLESYRLIPLTQGQFAKVSPHRYEELSKYKWQAWWSHDTKSFYAVRSEYPRTRIQEYKMHRQILGLSKGDRKISDHINHDTLDNRDENLRIVTKQQNQWNSKRRKSNTSGYKGVQFCKAGNKWVARIKVNGTRIHIGRFPDPLSAHAAYCAAAKHYFGEFMNPG